MDAEHEASVIRRPREARVQQRIARLIERRPQVEQMRQASIGKRRIKIEAAIRPENVQRTIIGKLSVGGHFRRVLEHGEISHVRRRRAAAEIFVEFRVDVAERESEV